MKLALLFIVPVIATASILLPTISLEVSERQPDSISVRWAVNDTDETIDSFLVSVADETDDSHITYRGAPFINVEEFTAMVKVHVADQAYNVCVVAVLKPNDELSTDSVSTCIETSTIKVMQLSSIIALVVIVLFFVLCVVGGYITWKCAAAKMKQHSFDKSDVNGNGDIVPLTHIED